MKIKMTYLIEDETSGLKKLVDKDWKWAGIGILEYEPNGISISPPRDENKENPNKMRVWSGDKEMKLNKLKPKDNWSVYVSAFHEGKDFDLNFDNTHYYPTLQAAFSGIKILKSKYKNVKTNSDAKGIK